MTPSALQRPDAAGTQQMATTGSSPSDRRFGRAEPSAAPAGVAANGAAEGTSTNAPTTFAAPRAPTGPKRTTLLVRAAVTGDPDLITLLLAHGASPNAADLQGVTPLIAAARFAAEQASANGAARTGIAAEPTEAWRRAIRNLLAKGADIHTADRLGEDGAHGGAARPVSGRPLDLAWRGRECP